MCSNGAIGGGAENGVPRHLPRELMKAEDCYPKLVRWHDGDACNAGDCPDRFPRSGGGQGATEEEACR